MEHPFNFHIPTTPSFHSRQNPQTAPFATPSAAAAKLVSTPGHHVSVPTGCQPLEDLRAQCAAFLPKFDAWMSARRREIEERRVEHSKACDSLTDTETELRKQIETYKNKQSELQLVCEKERQEASNLESEVINLKSQKDEQDTYRADIEGRIRAVTADIARQREDLRRAREARQLRQTEDRPELELYQDKLAMEIVGIHTDLLEFKFTHVNDQRWDEIYSFSLDVSRKEYEVVSCSPQITDLNKLVKWLNDSRDFYAFLKAMRKAFSDYAKTLPRM
ncbi:kinetochore-associated Ndc80 complex subunit spc25, partial [Rhizophlyctis rosea]